MTTPAGQAVIGRTATATREARKYFVAALLSGLVATLLAGLWLMTAAAPWGTASAGLAALAVGLGIASATDVVLSRVRSGSPRADRHRYRGSTVGLCCVGLAAGALLTAQWSVYGADTVAMSNRTRGLLVALVCAVVVVRVGLTPRAPHRHAARVVLIAASVLIALSTAVPHASGAAALAETATGVMAWLGAALLRPQWGWP